ncbi:MAG: GNAT family N-acetyltransferase [Cellulosilyticum sp.]|nr:GNAT family N-acetyltransferase [Cellulosilyticum sp.]
MDIIIRRAQAEDALFLTSISFGAKKYWNSSKEAFITSNNDLMITEEYLKENIVFVAQKQDTIIGYCSLHETKEGTSQIEQVIKEGYWLEHLFIRPAYIQKGIGRRLIEEVTAYCGENNIREFSVISTSSINGFYEKIGAEYMGDIEINSREQEVSIFRFNIREEDEEIASSGAQLDTDTLSYKLSELDREDLDTREDNGEQDDNVDNQGLPNKKNSTSIQDSNLYDEICDEGDYHNETLANLQQENKEEYCERIDGQEKVARLSYEEFLNSTVSIGYKFECEEEEELLNKKNAFQSIEKKYDVERDSMEALSIEELDVLLGNKEIDEDETTIEEYKEKGIETISDDYKEDEMAQNGMAENKQEEIELNKDEVEDLIAATAEVVLDKNDEDISVQYQASAEEIIEKEKVKELIDLYSLDTQMNTQVIYIDKHASDHLVGNVKTEKDKMLAGEMYIAWGDEIVNDRKNARKLLREFNNADPEDKRITHMLLKQLFGKVGEYIHIEPTFKCTYGYNIEVGDNLYLGYNCVIVDHARVQIGDNCIISPQVGIYTLAYPLNVDKRVAGYEYAQSVTIGDNVWIGGGATINPGVTIGNNVVVSPGSVVVSNIPDNVLVSGNPARIIRNIEE